jgi:hypothetical protein
MLAKRRGPVGFEAATRPVLCPREALIDRLGVRQVRETRVPLGIRQCKLDSNVYGPTRVAQTNPADESESIDRILFAVGTIHVWTKGSEPIDAHPEHNAAIPRAKFSGIDEQIKVPKRSEEGFLNHVLRFRCVLDQCLRHPISLCPIAAY